MEFNFIAITVAAFVPLIVGFFWYNPKVFGNPWMQAAGITDEQIKAGNMAKIFGLAFVFAFLLALMLPTVVNHQMGAMSLIGGDVEKALPSYHAFMDDYGNAFRTFKHGVLHGVLVGIFFVLPILGTNALFERKSAKYIFINVGFWIVSLAIMGGIICGWQ